MDIRNDVLRNAKAKKDTSREKHGKGWRRMESTRTNTSRLLIYWRV